MTKESKTTHNKTTIKNEGLVAEMIYNRKEKSTRFAVKKKDKDIEYVPHIETDFGEIHPLPPEKDYIQTEAVKFPSRAADFESRKELVNDIQNFVHKYLDITPSFEQTVPYYVLLTWVFDQFHELPYLRALGDYGSGKSRFLKTIGSICYKPIFAGGSTTVSPIFRMVDNINGTLILDEADYRYSDKTKDIVKILNNGYDRGQPVMRAEGQGSYDVRNYDVYGPKIVATRESFNDQALESRFIVEEMGQRELRKDIPLSLESEFYEHAGKLRNKLLRWRLDNIFKPISKSGNMESNIQPRLRQIASPLLRLIQDEQIKKDFLRLMKSQHSRLKKNRQTNLSGKVLKALLKLIDEGYSRMKVKKIAEILNAYIDNEDISSKKTGYILREQLRLNTERMDEGNYGIVVSNNHDRIEILKEKYGYVEE